MIELAQLNAQQTKKQMTFIGACRDFFGIKPGQPLKDFADEIRSLQQKDRDDLIAMFEENGYLINRG